MGQIGLAIVGRHPGFQIFEKIDWMGPDPADADIHTYIQEGGGVYAAVQLGASYDTYEYVVSNFVSSAARDEDFRLVMRLPHSHALLDDDHSPVLPTFVLREIFDIILRAHSLVLQGNYYRIPNGVMVPEFPLAEITATLARYKVIKAWNAYITMNEQVYNPAFIEAAEIEIALRLNALLHCTPLQEASVVYFGRFRDTVRPTYAFSDAEMRWQNSATARVTCRDGALKVVQLGQQPVALSSDAFGYDRRVYVPVSCQLSVPMVVDAYRHGRNSVPSASTEVNLTINPYDDAVNVVFRPKPVDKTFRVQVVRADNRETPSFRNADLLTTLDSGTFEPVKPQGYVRRGQDILDFERMMQDPAVLKSMFTLGECSFALDSVALAGDVIKVYVRYVEPKREPKAKPAPQGAAATLSISVPRRMGSEREFVVLNYVSPGNNDAVEILRDVLFEYDGAHDAYAATIAIPSNLADKDNFVVQLGEVPKARVITTQHNGAYYANFANTRDVHGVFSRFFSLFTWRYGLTLGWAEKLSRALMIVAVIFIIFVVGMGFGLWTGTYLHKAQELARDIIPQVQQVQTESLQPEEPEALPEASYDYEENSEPENTVQP